MSIDLTMAFSALKILFVVVKLFGVTYIPLFQKLQHLLDFLFPIPMLIIYTYCSIKSLKNFNEIHYANSNSVVKISDFITCFIGLVCFYLHFGTSFLRRNKVNQILLLAMSKDDNIHTKDVVVIILFVVMLIADSIFSNMEFFLTTSYYIFFIAPMYVNVIYVLMTSRATDYLKNEYYSMNCKLMDLDANNFENQIDSILKQQSSLESTCKMMVQIFSLPNLCLLSFNFCLITEDIYYITSTQLNEFVTNSSIIIINTMYTSLLMVYEIYCLIKLWNDLEIEVGGQFFLLTNYLKTNN